MIAGSSIVAIPGEVWGLILRFIPSKSPCMLASTCSWLRQLVLSAVEVIEIFAAQPHFPAERLLRLQEVVMSAKAAEVPMMEALYGCPQLRKLTLSARVRPALETLPHFPKLEAVVLKGAVACGPLGRLLASCKTLRAVQIFLNRPLNRLRGLPREEYVCDFLRELSDCSALRQLHGLKLRDEEDKAQLCAAVGCWPQLQELSVLFEPDMNGWGGGPVACSSDGVLAAVAGGCPRLQQLALRTRLRAELSEEDMAHVAAMSELCMLDLGTFRVPLTLTAQLTRLTNLTDLNLNLRGESAESWSVFVEFVESCPLHSLALARPRVPAEQWAALLRVITTHESLRVVRLEQPADTGDAEVAAVLAEAICRSRVCQWWTQLPICLLSFVQAWNGRKPQAGLRKLHINDLHCRIESMSDDFTRLFLACVRSLPRCCPVAELDLLGWPKEALVKLVEAVAAKPLTNVKLRACVRPGALSSDRDLRDSGLLLRTVPYFDRLTSD
eukprot:PLAT9159.1.p1 GENE.PLAT9159.1~~PLAT9159.1.p1  ORF type:complete len:498 (-),score=85.21 PLAT9159.1:181-1674(-)